MTFSCKVSDRSVRFELLEWMEVSSANSSHRAGMNKGKSFMYRENKSGPNTEPCGTPYFKGSKVGVQKLICFKMRSNVFVNCFSSGFERTERIDIGL